VLYIGHLVSSVRFGACGVILTSASVRSDRVRTLRVEFFDTQTSLLTTSHLFHVFDTDRQFCSVLKGCRKIYS